MKISWKGLTQVYCGNRAWNCFYKITLKPPHTHNILSTRLLTTYISVIVAMSKLHIYFLEQELRCSGLGVISRVSLI